MRKLKWTLGVAAIAVLALAQGGSQLLGGYNKAMTEAQTLKATYTLQVLGGTANQYSIDFSKPNLARIETQAETIVADGKFVTRYDKKTNTYYKDAQTPALLSEVMSDDAFNVWAPFFDEKALKPVSSKSLGSKNRKGMTLNTVEATFGGGKVMTLYINSEDNTVRQAELKYKDMEKPVLMDTKSFEIGAKAGDASMYAFKAPAGAQELTMDQRMSAKWYYDLDEAMKDAARSGRKIFCDFMASWCGPCKLLDREVLQTEDFKQEYSKNFVFLKIDVDQQPAVSQKYGITAMPTQMILDKDGNVLGKVVGYGGPQGFYNFINQYR
ncbi:MAG: thioredoxin family protein [Fimbriimonadaceae bacterium]|nr:thioredoxin family protein [Fimbriimonadaceae bacterium]